MNNAMPPGGWPLRMAIFALARPEQRNVVSQCEALLARGDAWENQRGVRQLLWVCLVFRHTRGEIIVRGRPDGTMNLIDLEPGLMRGAVPDYDRDCIDLGGLRLHNVQISDARVISSDTPESATHPKGEDERPRWEKKSSEEWFKSRITENPPPARWHSLQADWAAAKLVFAGNPPRNDIELLRQQFVKDRIRAGR